MLREVQERLYNFNYEIGVLSGQMTEETHNAIWAWQRYVKRAPTGELADAELSQLRSARLPTTFWGVWPTRQAAPAQWLGTGRRPW